MTAIVATLRTGLALDLRSSLAAVAASWRWACALRRSYARRGPTCLSGALDRLNH